MKVHYSRSCFWYVFAFGRHWIRLSYLWHIYLLVLRKKKKCDEGKKERKDRSERSSRPCECTSLCFNTLLIYILLTSKFFPMFSFIFSFPNFFSSSILSNAYHCRIISFWLSIDIRNTFFSRQRHFVCALCHQRKKWGKDETKKTWFKTFS